MSFVLNLKHTDFLYSFIDSSAYISLSSSHGVITKVSELFAAYNMNEFDR